jgi:D-alanyl-D-alanine carboxypeptidase
VKTIDPAALRAAVEATAKELLIPGAVVEVRTPQGDFTASVGTTLRGTCRVPEVGPGSLTSGDRWSDMIPACRCGCCT